MPQENPYVTNKAPEYDRRGYRTHDEVFDALGPRHEYAAPEGDPAPYTDNANASWAPGHASAFSAGNDSHRLGNALVHDYRPSPTEAPEVYYRGRDADDKARHAVEYQDADGWTEQQGHSKRVAPDPRSVPSTDLRPTARMAPTTYQFTRPFDQHSARTFNGLHFSMADHRRSYDILGMEPVRSRRNTYRIEPPNWDTNIGDVPPESAPPIGRPIQAVEIPQAFEARSYRLM